MMMIEKKNTLEFVSRTIPASVSELLVFSTFFYCISTMKNKPQKIVSIDVARDKVSSLFRVSVWKGFLVKLIIKEIMRSRKTTRA